MLSNLIKILDFYIINIHNKRIINQLDITKFQTVIDIGSHKAEFFRSLLKYNIEVTKYISFEPIKELYLNLFKEFKDNSEFEVFNLALSSVKGFKKINLSPISSTNTFQEINNLKLKYKLKKLLIFFIKEKNKGKELVKVDLLDNLDLEIKNHIDLVKIDVEGHEIEVLRGSSFFFKKYIPRYIIVEIHKKDNYKNYDAEEVKNFIKKLGYVELKAFRGPFYLFTDLIFEFKEKD